MLSMMKISVNDVLIALLVSCVFAFLTNIVDYYFINLSTEGNICVMPLNIFNYVLHSSDDIMNCFIIHDRLEMVVRSTMFLLFFIFAYFLGKKRIEYKYPDYSHEE